jgi:hypothetical protein
MVSGWMVDPSILCHPGPRGMSTLRETGAVPLRQCLADIVYAWASLVAFQGVVPHETHRRHCAMEYAVPRPLEVYFDIIVHSLRRAELAAKYHVPLYAL